MKNSTHDVVSPGIRSIAAARFSAAVSLLAVLCMLLLTAVQGKAQTTTADVVGTVTDSSGAVLPNAKVTVENLATHGTHTTQTTSSGDYDVPFLLPGHYSVRVELASFKTFSVADITLQVGDRARVDAQLQIGDASQTVEVLRRARYCKAKLPPSAARLRITRYKIFRFPRAT